MWCWNEWVQNFMHYKCDEKNRINDVIFINNKVQCISLNCVISFVLT